MPDGKGRYTNAKLNLLQRLLIPHVDAGRDFRRLLLEPVGAGLQRRKLRATSSTKSFVAHIPGRRDDHVIGNEEALVVVEQNSLFESLHRFLGSQNRFAERMVVPEVLREDLVDEIVGIIFVHLDLFQNHAALARQLGRIECRIQHQVAEDV